MPHVKFALLGDYCAAADWTKIIITFFGAINMYAFSIFIICVLHKITPYLDLKLQNCCYHYTLYIKIKQVTHRRIKTALSES